MNKINPKYTLLALAISAFAIGSTEFISVGLLPLISSAMNISITTAGLTVSLYALGVTIGAPLLTIMTSKIGRKKLLILIMSIFIVGNIISATAPVFSILIVGRIIAALSHGLFMSIASLIAAEVVSSDKRASAIAIMFTGLTVATITGVPLGTYVGQIAGWRASFVFLTIMGLIALVLNQILVPNTLKDGEQITFGDMKKVLATSKILLLFIITALGYGGTFVVYTYISPLLNLNLGFTENQIVVILILYGIMVAIGNTIGGKFANKNPLKALIAMFALLTLSILSIGFVLHTHIIGLIAILIMGLFAFMNVPGLQLLAVELGEKYVPTAITMVSALNIAAFNIGILVGSELGGEIVNSTGLAATPFWGAGMVALALVLTIMWYQKDKTLSNKAQD